MGAKENRFVPSSGTKGEALLLPATFSPSQVEKGGMQAPEPSALALDSGLEGRGWQRLSMSDHGRGFSGCPSHEHPCPGSHPVSLSTVQLPTPMPPALGHTWTCCSLSPFNVPYTSPARENFQKRRLAEIVCLLLRNLPWFLVPS